MRQNVQFETSMPVPLAVACQDAALHQLPQALGGNRLASSITESARSLARSTVSSVSKVLPWLAGTRETREEIEDAFARHFERQLEEEGALCLNCGSTRVNYCERHGLTGISMDGYFETTSEAGYLCDDCGAFEDGVIQVEVEEGV